MAAAAHNPQAGESFLERARREWIEPEYQPPAGYEGAVEALQRPIRNLSRDEGPGKPRHGEGCLLLELFYALRAKLHPFGNPALCKVLARERQSGLPRVNANDSQRWPGARGLDGEPAGTAADVQKRAGPPQRCA